MLRSCSLSKLTLFKVGFCLLVVLFSSCMRAGSEPTFRSYAHYAISPANAADDTHRQWADYLYNHLFKRSGKSDYVQRGKNDESEETLKIIVDFNPDAGRTYAWRWAGDHTLTLKAANKDAMLWSLYQLMANIGKVDSRFDVTDLPERTWDMGVDKEGDFPFEYRSIYSPSHRNEDLFGVTACGNIDYDWAIWGHNLHKVLGENLPSEVFAQVEGVPNTEQYCFSSEAFYNRLATYILDQYGDGRQEGARFMVMPNDNSIVCNCAKCRARGNTTTSATPAVSHLIARLAIRFPHHTFFTSSYASVVNPPAQKMPDNVGVVVSAMELPLTTEVAQTPEAAQFRQLLARWREKVGRIYIWDYMRNFDDYLTPYPILAVAQNRLRFYRDEGVNGIIYNGSGEDYATFDVMQTHVLSALMVNPDLNFEELVRADFKQRYPKTADILTDYYLSLENSVRARRKPLPYYGGIGDAVKSYLDIKAFTDFVEKLDEASKKVKGAERNLLNRLLTGLNFTNLELLRLPQTDWSQEAAVNYIDNLYGYESFPDMKNYREAYGNIDSYLANFRARAAYQGKTEGITCSDVPMLTDGYVGLCTDYHTNWWVTSLKQETLEVKLTLSQPKGTLRLSSLNAPKWGIYYPSAVELLQNGHVVGRMKPIASPSGLFMQTEIQIPYSGTPSAPYTLRMTRSHEKGKNTMAFDEISY